MLSEGQPWVLAALRSGEGVERRPIATVRNRVGGHQRTRPRLSADATPAEESQANIAAEDADAVTFDPVDEIAIGFFDPIRLACPGR